MDENRKKELEKKHREISIKYKKRGNIECDIPLDLNEFTVEDINYMISLEKSESNI